MAVGEANCLWEDRPFTETGKSCENGANAMEVTVEESSVLVAEQADVVTPDPDSETADLCLFESTAESVDSSTERIPFKEDRYETISVVGTGAMGTVYRAKDRRLNRDVALKRLKRDAAQDPERFLREATLLAGLCHDNLVRVYDVGQDGDGAFLVMELVEGKTLKQLTEDGTQLDSLTAAEVGSQIAHALAYAHGREIIHRDLKPANILITAQGGRAKLTDFGLARDMAINSEMTQVGTLAGTFDYMAPEQLREGAAVDHRCDIYGLAATLYHCLTGQDTRAIREERLPPELRKPLLKALEHKPDQRYQSAAEFADELAQVCNRLRGVGGHVQGLCDRCHAPVAEVAKFCLECGAPQFADCPQCGKQNRTGTKHCGACGHAIQGAIEKRWKEIEAALAEAEQRWVAFEHQIAVDLLEPIAAETDPVYAQAVQLANEKLAAVRRAKHKFEQERDHYYKTLQQMLQEKEYKKAEYLARDIPAEYFDNAMRTLVDKAKLLRRQVKKLCKLLEEALTKKDLKKAAKLTKRLLELRPQLPGLDKTVNYFKRKQSRPQRRRAERASVPTDDSVPDLQLPVEETVPDISITELESVDNTLQIERSEQSATDGNTETNKHGRAAAASPDSSTRAAATTKGSRWPAFLLLAVAWLASIGLTLTVAYFWFK